jgi:BirA family biotin operon repressor/biotin-[acetyl-CoA-carboxylase] ligase
LSGNPNLWLGEGLDPGPEDFWSRAFVIGDADSSQFDILHRVLGSGSRFPGPVATLALRGKNFHGQRGRAWQADPGNFHLCAGFEDLDLDTREGLALTMLPAVAVVDAVRSVSHGRVKPGIKWVNDILVDDRKIAGVITSTQTMRGKITAVTLGIGINITHAPRVPPTPFVPAAGCLGTAYSMTDVWTAVLAALGKHYLALLGRGPDALFRPYRESSAAIGREVCIWDESLDEIGPKTGYPQPRLRGILRDIRPDLSLVIEGQDRPVSKGRLAFSNWKELRLSGPDRDR